MNTVSKLALSIFAAGAFALSSLGAVPVARAGTAVVPEASAPIINKAQAIQIAQSHVLKEFNDKTVVILAILEKEDNGLVHWSIDLRGSKHEFEVWVSTSGAVLKTIVQPL